MTRLARFSIFVFALLITLWVAGFISFYASTYNHGAPKIRTDAIVVLTGGPDRVNAGLDLLDAGKAETLFISGVYESVSIQALLRLWRDDVEEPPCCIMLGHEAANTTGNAAEVRKWVTQSDVRSIRLITASYHMPRALIRFRHALPDIEIVPHPLYSRDIRRNSFAFWRLLVQEYNKMLATWLLLKLYES